MASAELAPDPPAARSWGLLSPHLCWPLPPAWLCWPPVQGKEKPVLEWNRLCSVLGERAGRNGQSFLGRWFLLFFGATNFRLAFTGEKLIVAHNPLQRDYSMLDDDSHQPQWWLCRELPLFCTAVAPYKAPNGKPKPPCDQPERNRKNSLSCLFVPSLFPTLHKLSSIIDCSVLPLFIDCTSLLIPNCCFHFFTESGWPFRQLCHLSWHWNHRFLVI